MTKREAIPADHVATVVLNDDGSLSFTTDAVNMTSEDNGGSRKLVSVIPNPDERVVRIEDHPEHFARLTSINVSVTNACNLSCSYCYEQHNKDYGRFTVQSIKQAYDFLNNINSLPDKNLIFFGGEPLIHKKLILDFLSEHHDEVFANEDMRISMVSNGLLLTPDFIDPYFALPNTQIILSIDTFDASVDKRGIGQKRLDTLYQTIQMIPEDVRRSGRVIVRPTISYENAKSLTEFLDRLFDIGIVSFIIQPLIMGNVEGFLDWTDEDWKSLTDKVRAFFFAHPEIHIEVTEGVGSRTVGNNCLSGYDIISIDPSGDFSGCFFFVNQKDKAGGLISGNIFKGNLFIEREKAFDKQYREMFVQHEQCRTCDLQDHCYQCPAGNLDTGGIMYRPDAMCQKFVKFYLDIRDARFRSRWNYHVNEIHKDFKQHGEKALRIWLLNMMAREFHSCYLDEELADHVTLVGLRNLFGELLLDQLDSPEDPGDVVALAMIAESNAIEHSWDEIHSVLLERHEKRSIRVPANTLGTMPGLMMYLSLMRTVFYDG